ncbi:MAG: hypothetical protein II393_01375 [Cytophagales bacterium]|nr:hypothetical protein [Cytophagales bacterium]MBQ5918982.1 hypothetical protein [Lachnospiraceae bacterium]
MAQYEVQIDVTMSGTLYITAENEQQARVVAEAMQFVASDLKNFYQVSAEVVDINKE